MGGSDSLSYWIGDGDDSTRRRVNIYYPTYIPATFVMFILCRS